MLKILKVYLLDLVNFLIGDLWLLEFAVAVVNSWYRFSNKKIL